MWCRNSCYQLSECLRVFAQRGTKIEPQSLRPPPRATHRARPRRDRTHLSKVFFVGLGLSFACILLHGEPVLGTVRGGSLLLPLVLQPCPDL